MMAGTGRSAGLLVTFTAALALAPGCDVEVEEEGEACVQARIYHGAPRPSTLSLSADQRAAIVAVYPDDRGAICSGVVVAAGVAVTAGHCVDPGRLDALRIGYWHPSLPETGVRSAEVHPEVDVAVLLFAAGALGERLEPLPLIDHGIDESWVGARVELAGYGGTEEGGVGGLRFVHEAIVAVEAATIVVDGLGHSGACGGDSGGPLLARDDLGRVRVVGLLDSGHASCVQDDHYVRTDALAQWWPSEGLEARGDERGCEGLDREGSCVRGRAMRCGEGGSVEVEVCGAGQRCGQAPAATGFTCVSESDDVCEGAGSRASCDGDLLVRCGGGELRAIDCGLCGGSCAGFTPGGEAGCVAPASDGESDPSDGPASGGEAR